MTTIAASAGDWNGKMFEAYYELSDDEHPAGFYVGPTECLAATVTPKARYVIRRRFTRRVRDTLPHIEGNGRTLYQCPSCGEWTRQVEASHTVRTLQMVIRDVLADFEMWPGFATVPSLEGLPLRIYHAHRPGELALECRPCHRRREASLAKPPYTINMKAIARLAFPKSDLLTAYRAAIVAGGPMCDAYVGTMDGFMLVIAHTLRDRVQRWAHEGRKRGASHPTIGSWDRRLALAVLEKHLVAGGYVVVPSVQAFIAEVIQAHRATAPQIAGA